MPPACKLFSGYKPCFPGRVCTGESCADFDPIGTTILIVNLDAMGDVLMTTTQLPSLKQTYPQSTISWLTLANAAPLLAGNPFIDRVFAYGPESLSILGGMAFDIVVNVDKTQRSCAAAMKVPAGRRLGFGMNERGQIIPLNEGARYNYRLGLDDTLKFRENTRTRQDYVAETLEVPYRRDEYVFALTDEERAFTARYRESAGIPDNAPVIGFNTGCSTAFPNKKMTVAQHAELIERFLGDGRFPVVLVGGPEDTARNAEIAALFPGRVVNTPTTEGVRRGSCYESIPDIIITGDSFGMHLAIALKKYVIAWFGLSCHQEVDLYGRGDKLYPEGLACSPCWKRECPYNLECIRQIDLDLIERETIGYFERQGRIS
ncbi:glycosyltransferase family 9 protein [Candidatus Latescibacterota bacterium]